MISCGSLIARNIAASRARRRLQQSDLADRMRALGWNWVRQTVSEVEHDRRRLTAEEIFGLALALETTIPALMSATEQDGYIQLPGGRTLRAASVALLAGRGTNDRTVTW